MRVVVDATPGRRHLDPDAEWGGVTNTSTMEASAGGVLVINTTVDNAGGNITTADGASTVEVDAGTVQGGTLNNSAGGTFETTAGSELDGLTDGSLTISAGSVITSGGQYHHVSAGYVQQRRTIVQVGGNGQARIPRSRRCGHAHWAVAPSRSTQLRTTAASVHFMVTARR